MSILREALCLVPDHRGCRGRVYGLDSLCLLVILGFACGRTSLAGVARLAQELGREEREALGFLWFRVPGHATLCVQLQGLDADALEAALGRVALAEVSQSAALALDGKTVRGSRDGENDALHLLSCFAHACGAVLAQCPSAKGGGEVKAALELLENLPLKGKIITGDAMFTDKKLCHQIVEKGGDYLFPVKNNQRSLKAAIDADMAQKKAGIA